MIIPATMRAARQYEPGGALHIEEVPVPKPQNGQVLVKLHSCPVNPSDLSFLQGTYAEKPEYPVTPGIEACGTVVAEGGGMLAKLRNSKRVACTSTKAYGGTWAEYIVTSAMHCIPVNNKLDDDQASMLIVNPMTAVAFIDIAKQCNAKCIVQTAAAGALGQMLAKLAKQNSIETINIVRSAANARTLQQLGVENILISEADDFFDELQTTVIAKHATLAFDCIGGDMTNSLVKVLPPLSTIVPYAKLSEEDSYFDARDVVQKFITIRGFFLAHWMQQQNLLKTLSSIKKAKQFLENSVPIQIQKKVPLEKINEAIELYRHNMGKGKVIIDMLH